MKTVVYIHGKGGSSTEAEHFEALFPTARVIGFDYKATTPWEAKDEFSRYFEDLRKTSSKVILIANSIGAYFSICAGIDRLIDRAYFISPVVDMERLILEMLAWAGHTEAELQEAGVIHTSFGEALSREYLSYVRAHRLEWSAPTSVLYGTKDSLIAYETIETFSKEHHAQLTLLKDGEHWFHTAEQMRFLDNWICEQEAIHTADCVIRRERKEEAREVENLIRESFWNVYRPGCLEHYVMHVLRDDPAFVQELDFVMEQDGALIGQNIFMKTRIDADDGRTIEVLTMGPICITPALKRKGYGKKLLDFSLQKATEMGFGAVLFEGNIGFYGKSGFDYARNFGIRYHDLPEGEDDSFFLCRELKQGYLDGVTGVYQTPAGYYVDEAATEEFDKAFPKKEKLKLPGQLF